MPREIIPTAYSAADVSIMLGISRSMVFKLVRQGELKTFKIGTRTLIPVSEIQDLIKSGGSKQNA